MQSRNVLSAPTDAHTRKRTDVPVVSPLKPVQNGNDPHCVAWTEREAFFRPGEKQKPISPLFLYFEIGGGNKISVSRPPPPSTALQENKGKRWENMEKKEEEEEEGNVVKKGNVVFGWVSLLALLLFFANFSRQWSPKRSSPPHTLFWYVTRLPPLPPTSNSLIPRIFSRGRVASCEGKRGVGVERAPLQRDLSNMNGGLMLWRTAEGGRAMGHVSHTYVLYTRILERKNVQYTNRSTSFSKQKLRYKI